MKIGEIIYTRRKELGLTLEEVGEAVGVGKSTVKKWETGSISNMRRDRISRLAQVLRLDPSVFINDETGTGNRIPLIGSIACGRPIFADENISEYIEAGGLVHADFALRCKGDSMTGARIYDGDIVFIRSQPTVENGEIAAVIINDEATLKRVYLKNGQLTLVAANPEYEPMVFSGRELETIHIIGKAVKFLGNLN